MVFFNYATMQMAAKIVYYGPGLCGKTTNLHHIYAKTSPQSRGEMVSLETETDRTLFFDLLPIDVGVIGGFKTRLQLYTVPGQVFYNTTRKLVLKGVDGLVFVADSQKAMLEANVESFKNLRDNLAEIGLNIDEVPIVIQLNKRDLPNISDVNAILDVLDPDRLHDHAEAVASAGKGVFETLKQISKLTLRTLRRRMTGEDMKSSPPRRPIDSQFKVQQEPPAGPARTIAGTAPAPVPAPAAPSVAPIPPTPKPAPAPISNSTRSTQKMPAFTGMPSAAASVTATATPPQGTPAISQPTAQPISQPIAQPVPPPEPEPFAAASSADVDTRIIADAPIAEAPAPTQYIPPPQVAKSAPAPPQPAPPPIAEPAADAGELTIELTPPEKPAARPAPEPDIDFGQVDRPIRKPPEVKHVKVRSSVDVMAELESLRKRATQSTPKPPRKDTAPAGIEISIPRPPRELHKTLAIPVAPGILPRAKSIRVTVSFENEEGAIQVQEQRLELGDTSDVHSVSVNLKIEPL
jgi:signal recognition particle receptor subunit beta